MKKNIIKIILGIFLGVILILGAILILCAFSALEIARNGFIFLDFGFMSIFSGTCEMFGRSCFEIDISSNIGTLEFLLTGR
jgi:hypothetical protein